MRPQPAPKVPEIPKRNFSNAVKMVLAVPQETVTKEKKGNETRGSKKEGKRANILPLKVTLCKMYRSLLLFLRIRGWIWAGVIAALAVYYAVRHTLY